MSEQTNLIVEAATTLAAAKAKQLLAEKEVASAQKRVLKMQGEVALAQKALDDAAAGIVKGTPAPARK